MPIPMTLPKGCPSIRGGSDIRRYGSSGSRLTQQANRLYMLTIKRESVMTKKQTLESRLKELSQQLQGIEADIQATERAYKRGNLNGSLQKAAGRTAGATADGRAVKKIRLQF